MVRLLTAVQTHTQHTWTRVWFNGEYATAVAPLFNTQDCLNPCRVKRHLRIRLTLKRSQSCNRAIHPSIPYVRPTYVMFGHTPPQSAVVRSVSTLRSLGSTAPGPNPLAARSSSLPKSCALMVRGPRRVWPQVIDSSLDTQRGRSYLRRARPVESELALHHALCLRVIIVTDVGPDPRKPTSAWIV